MCARRQRGGTAGGRARSEQRARGPRAARPPVGELQLGPSPWREDSTPPLFVTYAGDGSDRRFVEQGGRICVVRFGGRCRESPSSTCARRISSGGERGLLGLAFAPDYASSGEFYVNYTDREGDTVVVASHRRRPLERFSRVRAGRNPCSHIEQPYATITVAASSSSRDPSGSGSAWATAAREAIRRQRPEPGLPARQDARLGLRRAVWPPSLRSSSPACETRGASHSTARPWTCGSATSAKTTWEEVDFVAAGPAQGVNWGWNLWEGTPPFPAGSAPPRKGFTLPRRRILARPGPLDHRRLRLPGQPRTALVGAYLYGDFEAGWIAALRRMAPGGAGLNRAR